MNEEHKSRRVAPLTEGKMSKGGLNPPNTSTRRPPPPQGSGGKQQVERAGRMPDFDEMTPKNVREWGKEIAWQASQFGEIKATLIVNCREGRALRKLGIEYDDTKLVLPNLVHILQQLTEMAKGKS
jgi:hypothetical protein